MEEKNSTFPDGLMWFKPREGAPDFVKGTLSVSPERLIAWMRAHKDLLNNSGYFALDLKKSKGGKLYFQANTYKPKPKQEVRDIRDEQEPFDDRPFPVSDAPEPNPDAIPW